MRSRASAIAAWALVCLPVLAAEGKRLSAVQMQASIFGLVMEEATFADAEVELGPAEVRHNRGDAAGSAYFACYVGKDGTALVLQAHAEQGGGAITSFQLLQSSALADFTVYRYRPPADALPKCGKTPRLMSTAKTGAGLRLGLTRDETIRILGTKPERSTGSELSFVLTDKERGQRDVDKTDVRYPTAWVSVILSGGRVVAIRSTYSSMM